MSQCASALLLYLEADAARAASAQGRRQGQSNACMQTHCHWTGLLFMSAMVARHIHSLRHDNDKRSSNLMTAGGISTAIYSTTGQFCLTAGLDGTVLLRTVNDKVQPKVMSWKRYNASCLICRGHQHCELQFHAAISADSERTV